MAYIRNGNRAAVEALRVRQQIEAAEVERAEKELAEIQAVELELERIRRRREQVSQGLRQARQRTENTRAQLRMPKPVYGGREGLEAAAQECAAHKYKAHHASREQADA